VSTISSIASITSINCTQHVKATQNLPTICSVQASYWSLHLCVTILVNVYLLARSEAAVYVFLSLDLNRHHAFVKLFLPVAAAHRFL
jgi:hypothetical protein